MTTTHITGVIADIGIELGKLPDGNVGKPSVVGKLLSDTQRLGGLGRLARAPSFGGVIGAIGFEQTGGNSTLPLASVRVLPPGLPATDELRAQAWRWRFERLLSGQPK